MAKNAAGVNTPRFSETNGRAFVSQASAKRAQELQNLFQIVLLHGHGQGIDPLDLTLRRLPIDFLASLRQTHYPRGLVMRIRFEAYQTALCEQINHALYALPLKTHEARDRRNGNVVRCQRDRAHDLPARARQSDVLG